VVPSQRFEAPLTAHPFNIYRSLRDIKPVALHVLTCASAIKTLVGASPSDGPGRGREITLRPIAGTRRRGVT